MTYPRTSDEESEGRAAYHDALDDEYRPDPADYAGADTHTSGLTHAQWMERRATNARLRPDDDPWTW